MLWMNLTQWLTDVTRGLISFHFPTLPSSESAHPKTIFPCGHRRIGNGSQGYMLPHKHPEMLYLCPSIPTKQPDLNWFRSHLALSHDPHHHPSWSQTLWPGNLNALVVISQSGSNPRDRDSQFPWSIWAIWGRGSLWNKSVRNIRKREVDVV